MLSIMDMENAGQKGQGVQFLTVGLVSEIENSTFINFLLLLLLQGLPVWFLRGKKTNKLAQE